MTFVDSNIKSGAFYLTYLSGSNGIAASKDFKLYYTVNSGISWDESSGTSGNFYSIYLSGEHGIACSNLDYGIYYSNDGGKTWIPSNISSGDFSSVSMSGANGIVGSLGYGIWYTSDYGVNWTQSDITTGNFNSVSMSGTNGIASRFYGIYYTNNSGENWIQSNSDYDQHTLCLSRHIGIAGSNYNYGILYTSDAGVNWSQSNKNRGVFVSISMSETGITGVAASPSENGASFTNGLYYTSNSGEIWEQISNTADYDFYSVSLSGTNGVAGSNAGIWYTNDSGVSWSQSTITTGTFPSVFISELQAIAGSDGNGIYYNLTPLCYEKNVEILCLVNNSEIYVKISEIEVGMFVKAYKHGYVKVKEIKGVKYSQVYKENDLACLYKMKDNNNIILTGGHSLLEDKITEEQENNKYNFHEFIEDKKLLLVALSDKFEKVTDDKEYEIYHIVLENTNKYGRYGIYITDNILSESCSENNIQIINY